jgi:hypothetical protein
LPERSRKGGNQNPAFALETSFNPQFNCGLKDVIRYKLLVIGSLSNFFRIRPLHLLGDTGGAEESPGTGAKNLLTNNK